MLPLDIKYTDLNVDKKKVPDLNEIGSRVANLKGNECHTYL